MKRALVLLGLLSLAGCFGGTPVADVPEYIPAFPGYPPITPYAGADCPTVLAIGDSLMFQAQPYLEDVLADSGRCATVIEEAVGGTGPIGTGGGVDWQTTLPTLLALHQPEIVVMEFVGNSNDGQTYGSQSWSSAQKQATLQLIDQVKTLGAGAQVYVMAAPAAAWFCWFDYYGPFWGEYRAFVRGISAVGHGDWSTYLSPGDVYARQLSFSGRPYAVRSDDCTHFTERGAEIAAQVTAAAIQNEWQ